MLNASNCTSTVLIWYAFFFCFIVPATIDKIGLNENPKVLINHTTTLRCPAKGSPAPTIRWYKNSRPLDPASSNLDRIEAFGEGRQLRINAAQLTDSGSYSCVVINKAGEDSMDMELDVLGMCVNI